MGELRWGKHTPNRTIVCDGCEQSFDLKTGEVIINTPTGIYFLCTVSCMVEWLLHKEGLNTVEDEGNKVRICPWCAGRGYSYDEPAEGIDCSGCDGCEGCAEHICHVTGRRKYCDL